jgi:glycosyltransferase involved in cell wall biosynthesis
MKITYLAPSIIPSRSANSIHVMKMCQAFAKNGHEVTLIVPNRKDEIEQGVEDVYGFYGVERCFKIETIRWYKVKGRDHLYGLLAAFKARSLKPDIIYSRAIAGAYFAAKLLLPVIFEAHTPASYGSKIVRYFFNSLSKSSKLLKLVVITHALKDYFEKNFPHLTGKIQIAADGADPVGNTSTTKSSVINRKRFNLGYVGHLYKGRGIDLIIELARLCPWADFHLIGGNEADLAYWKHANKQENIIFHGFVPHAETVNLLRQFDVLLAPYQESVKVMSGYDTAQWMSPLKIFEYMSTGVPIIASDLSVLREVLQHERNALLCVPTNSAAWQSSLEMLKNNPDIGGKIGKNALEDFLRNYTWQARVSNVLE